MMNAQEQLSQMIAKAIAEERVARQAEEKNTFLSSENVNKLFLTIITAGMAWLINSTSNGNTERQLIRKDIEGNTAALAELKQEVSDGTRDRFTRTDWQLESRQYRDDLASAMTEQRERGDWMDEMNLWRLNVDNKLEQLENK
jgi:hypothetical protein